MAKLKPEVLIDKLRVEAAKSDEQSEELYDKFMEGQMTPEAFVAEYCKLRKVFHIRELKQQAAAQTLT